jgi:hypothetical protein
MAFLSPAEIESMVRALDTAIHSLDNQIRASTEPRVNELFREAWSSFMSRWQIERDNWLGSVWSRMFASQFASRFEDYKLAYQRWVNDFQQRVPGALSVPLAESESSFFGLPELSAQTVLLLAGIVVGFWLFTKGKK